MHFRTFTALLLPLAVLVHSYANDEYGLRARQYYDAELNARELQNDHFSKRDHYDDELLFERELYYNDLLDERDLHGDDILSERDLYDGGAYARDLHRFNNAKDLAARSSAGDDHPFRLDRRIVKESPCGYYAQGTTRYCTGKVSGDPVKTMTKGCSKCGRLHKFDSTHHLWAPLGKING